MSTIEEKTTCRVPRSMELYARAEQLIPGATQLISRRPSKYAKGVSPAYAARAKGARIWDVDGHEYIDWVSGIGAIILGYCDPVVDEAVCKQIETGVTYSISHELEIELAEELVATIPCAEMVRYAKGGGDACAVAVRIARGTTGRDKILFCGYHGWHDWYLAANLSTDVTLDSHLFPGIEPIGVPQALKDTAIPFEYGKIESLRALLEKNRGEVAAVIMEPLRSEEPPPGYLQAVKELAREEDAVLIFDEVSTGFRLSVGGAQPYLGIEPDMAVFAKSISNGYAMGAVVGTRAVMEPASHMFISSTYWGDLIGIRAALTTLREIRKRGVPDYLQDFGRKIIVRMNEVADETGLPARCCGISVHPHLEFTVDDANVSRQLSTLYVQEMAKRGCHGYPSFYLNAAQGDAELEQTTAAARETFAIMKNGLDAGNIGELLEADLSQDVFRRIVR